MEYSLTSSLSNSKIKPLISFPQHCNVNKNPKVVSFAVKCKATNNNFYKILSLTPGKASTNEIKKAYRSMALQHHPDVCQNAQVKEEATKMFALLNDAYKILSDPILREEYDCQMGFKTCGTKFRDSCIGGRSTWEEQILELKRRSDVRTAQKEGSWGRRVKARTVQFS